MSKLTKNHATLLSVELSQIVNPLGSPLYGKDRGGAPLAVPASGERYRLEFLLDDGSKWETVVAGAVNEYYVPGSRGILIRSGKQLKDWIGEEKEEGWMKARKRKIRNRVLITAASLLVLGSAFFLVKPWVVGEKPVTMNLQTAGGKSYTVSVRLNPNWTVTQTGEDGFSVRTRDAEYTILFPDDQDYRKQRNEYQDLSSDGSVIRSVVYADLNRDRTSWTVESFDISGEGEQQISFAENIAAGRRFLVEADSLDQGKTPDSMAVLARMRISDVQ